MPKYEFTTTITLQADTYESAWEWFNFETKDLETHVTAMKEIY
jgi:hypothetical protein